MATDALTYNQIKGVFERLFISPIVNALSIDESDYIKFSNLSKEQIMSMNNLAQRCYKYENAYNKSSSKFHWENNHARQYRDLRTEFVELIGSLSKKNKNYCQKKIVTDKQQSIEDVTTTLQEEHAKALITRKTKKTNCKWIKPGEKIIVQGIELIRGDFYIGDFFKIPQSYKKNRAFPRFHREYWDYNSNYRLLKIYGTVIQTELPISQDELKIVPFSSYLDMHPTHRYELLEWLSERKKVSEISAETFLFYLFGLQLRFFIDDSTTEVDRLDIIKHSINLYIQCQEEDVYYVELEHFIDAALSKCHLNSIFNLVPIGLIKRLQLFREALIIDAINNTNNSDTYIILENICRNLMFFLNSENTISKHQLTDDFYSKFAIMVKSEITTRHYDSTWSRLLKKDMYHTEKYCINDIKEFSMLRYDYIFYFHLFPIYYDMGFLNQCVDVCFNRIVKQMSNK